MARTKGIYKRGNIYWICYQGLDGSIIRETSGSRKYKAAEALLVQRRRATQMGEEPEVKRIGRVSFHQLVEEYLRWAEKQRSFDSKRYIVKGLLDTFGHTLLRRFNTMLVEQYQSQRLNEGVKPATANRYIATLKHMFRKAVDWEMVEEATLKKVGRVKLLEENNARLRYLSPEECQSLIAACDPHLRPIVITALHTGMRKGEILSLRWEENVDLRNNMILLTRTKNGRRREVPINTELRAVLSSQLRRIDIPWVFYGPGTGKPYGNIRRSFASALRRAGIKDFRFHDLRHTFASQMIMAGEDLVALRELLGHQDLKMTLRYAHLAPSHKRRAVERLGCRLKGEEEVDSMSFKRTTK